MAGEQRNHYSLIQKQRVQVVELGNLWAHVYHSQLKKERFLQTPHNPLGLNTRTQSVSKEESNTSWGLWHVSLVGIEIDSFPLLTVCNIRFWLHSSNKSH